MPSPSYVVSSDHNHGEQYMCLMLCKPEPLLNPNVSTNLDLHIKSWYTALDALHWKENLNPVAYLFPCIKLSYFVIVSHEELRRQAVSSSVEFTAWLCVQVKLLARHIGKPAEEIARDIRRPKYFSPSEAVEYGIIDKVNNLRANQKKPPDLITNSNLHVLQVIYNEKIQEDGGVVSDLKRSNLI